MSRPGVGGGRRSAMRAGRGCLAWLLWAAALGGPAAGSGGQPAPSPPSPPHIVMIIADDMGWNDVSFHGSDQIPTPNIDALAYNGVILNSHYTGALCSPSRAALLTGKLPVRTGMQHLVILEAEPRGLPLAEKLLPQYLREAGYATHAVGKWHQGFHRREYTPLFRGFDSHFGYWNGLQDYYTHDVDSSVPGEGFRGFDMRRNMSVARDTRGKYSTDLFTEEAVRLIERHPRDGPPMFLYLAHLAPHSGNDAEPLQAPDDEVARLAHVADPERRLYAAMVSRLDRSVGEVVRALRRSRMLDNSIVVFMSDNGASTQGIHYNRGSNYPLRGIKASGWEGAVRNAAAVWSPLIRRPKRVHDGLMYIADWLPTLMSAAGLPGQAELRARGIDGLDMWASISEGLASPRDELLLNIDTIFNYSTIRVGDFKYVLGTVGNGEDWYGESGRPEDAHLEGRSPAYAPELVLASEAATAISGLLTASQVGEVRRIRSDGARRVGRANLSSAELLTAEDVLRLRAAATLHCRVPANETIACNPKQAPCLFNVREDPCERRNLAASRPIILAHLENRLLKYKLTAVKEANVPNDPMANPKFWANTWVCWQDDDPLETLVDDEVGRDRLRDPNERMPGPLGLAVIAVLLALAVLGIFVLVGLRCSQRQRQLKAKTRGHRHRGRHFHELPQTELKPDDARPPGKTLGSFANELRNMPSDKDLARSIE
ncbi:arylsulfatase B-like isoform X2 [Phymastichus coffea]|nr:arylsulfatase B-like isoform X2 [Phymastichus coffea]